MATNQNPEKGTRILSCEAWEAMLTDALDGTLSAADAAAFTAHSNSCVACGELLQETRQGSEWLQFLRETPPAPHGLVERILAGTSGLPEAGPLVPAGAPVAIPHQPWLGMPMHMLQRHMAESRILMTLAMAFFSIALTLNLTGVRLNQIKLSDLKPTTLASTLSHQYFTTSKNVQRYYSNLRFVYELESRLNEIRQTSERPNTSAPAQPEQEQPQNRPAPSQSRPSGQPQSQPAAHPGSKNGGSAQKDPATAPPIEPARRGNPPLSVLAHLLLYPRTSLIQLPHSSPTLRACFSQFLYPGNRDSQSERSLV